MFETATRMKLRFPSMAGMLSVEDLWDLPIQSKTNRPSLDSIYKELNKALKTTEEESLVSTKSDADQTLQLQIDIVKHIFEVKQAETEARKTAADKLEHKKRIMALMAEKQDEQLKSKSLEELQKELDAL